MTPALVLFCHNRNTQTCTAFSFVYSVKTRGLKWDVLQCVRDISEVWPATTLELRIREKHLHAFIGV